MKLFKFIYLVIAATTLTWQATHAQQWDKLDQYFDTMDKYDRLMASVTVRKDGATVYQKTIGYKDANSKVKAIQEDKYRIGSISKTFTATLILKAAEEDKLTLNDKIINYFPEYNAAKDISIQDLLQHTSGIENITDKETYLSFYDKRHTSKHLLDSILQFKVNKTTHPSYSNSNYILLTFILEQVYKKSFEEILKEKITDPLQLKNTYVGNSINPSKGEVYSYTFSKSWQHMPETDMSVPQGAGNIVASSEDIALFFEKLFEGKIINEASLAKMTHVKNGFGLGIFELPFNDNVGYGHDGGIDGFTSTAVHYNHNNLTIAITSNASRININDLALTVLSAANGLPVHIPEISNYTADAAVEASYIGKYTSDLVPLIIHIFLKDGVLHAQAEGQSDFALSAIALHQYEFAAAGVRIHFNPEEQTMLLLQGGMEINFKKQ